MAPRATERGQLGPRIDSRLLAATLTILMGSWVHTACTPSKKDQPGAVVNTPVAALIDKMTNPVTEQQAFSELEALGCQAVPEIIQRMDDRRSLPNPQIALTNKSPHAFEGIRHYGPQLVVDALAAILNQLTGQDFGFIYNGASDAERTKTIQGWRNFLARTPAAKLCDGA